MLAGVAPYIDGLRAPCPVGPFFYWIRNMAQSPSWTARHEELQRDISRRAQARRQTQTREEMSSAETGRMPWSWHIARIAGIDIYIHATFVLLIAWLIAI